MNAELLAKEPSLANLKRKNSKLHFEEIPIKGYELVLKIEDASRGLKAIIAIHDTTLGTAVGGTRIYPYADFDTALEDVLRLAKGMTYKSAIADVGLGGGKSVIISDSEGSYNNKEMLHAFGEAIELLQGKYVCAEDLGCTTEHLRIVRERTKYVVGLSHDKSSGDPGRFTAWGTFRGIQSAIKKIYGSSSLEGKKVAVQGLGNVGLHLVEFLFWAGAEIVFSDLDQDKLHNCVLKYNGSIASPKEIMEVPCDVFAPCAMGAVLNDETIPHFRCKAIAGSANNQLLQDEHADLLKEKNILYAPDFVINAGGLLNVTQEIEKEGYNPVVPRKKADKIYDQLLAIYDISENNRISTHQAALDLAEYRIKYGLGRRTAPLFFHH